MTLPSQSLDGTWTLHGGPGADVPLHPAELSDARLRALPATVPGNVELALVAAGLAPDPLVAPNTWAFIAYETWGWWYERRFDLDPGLDGTWRIDLVLDGLDCIGSVWLNGVHLGDTANALIAHRLDATRALRPHGNHLLVRVSSGVREVRAADAGAPSELHQVSSFEALRLRKAAHQFGWDIMPRLVSAGLWRPVRLEAVPEHAITGAYWATMQCDPGTGTATVVADWGLRLPDAGWEHWSVEVEIVGLHREVVPVCSYRGRRILRLCSVKPWWPRGWGEAHRYQTVLRLRDHAGRVIDERQEMIGIRTVHLRRTEALAANGSGDFGLEVNGERIFCRGTNWVPLDALHSRDRNHLDEALAMLADLGCNSVRMWGGNVYEDEAFYAWCDANGMLVWQDFALACGTYPQDDAFAAALGAEATAVVQRLRNRPCLALWCGSNETDQAFAWWWPGRSLDPNRDRATRNVLADVVRTHDPARYYLPSSPYLSPAVQAGGGQPEDHLWGPRDDFKGTYYRRSPACFVSEIGYHGCPSADSLRRMLPAGTVLWPVEGNAALLPLAVKTLPGLTEHDGRIALMARQATQLIGRAPADLDQFVLASQLSQAEALKSFIETWRSRKGRTWGMLWWNLRDGWPLISDAVVDWFGQRKLAYGVVRASQQEVLALVEEAEGWQHRVVVINDLRHAVALDLVIDELGGRELWRGQVTVAANAVAEACHLPQVHGALACWRMRWSRTDGVSGTNHYLAGARPWPLERLSQWYRELGHPTP